MTIRLPITKLAPNMISAIRKDVYHFPLSVQNQGQAYLNEGRVGALEIDEKRVSATVRGRTEHRVSWQWDGRHADPLCSCPEGPVCKHSYALARAIEAERSGSAPQNPRPAQSRPFGRTFVERKAERTTESPAARRVGSERADLVEDVADWARQHARSSIRRLSASFGLDRQLGEIATVWMEARFMTSEAPDAPRTARQVQQIAADLRRQPAMLAPPQARLLRLLAATVQHAEPLDSRGIRFKLKASTLNRILDSFSDSTLATWNADDASVAGVQPGSRLQLGDAALEIVPLCVGEGADMRIMLAARWPDGRQRKLDEVVYIAADDDLHPSLVLTDGAFWRVSEEPPLHLMKRFTYTESLPVPETGRARFLELLASSFSSVADALAPHIRVHRARPVVTLDLGTDDWLEFRLFAHTGDSTWRPGLDVPGVTAFELSGDDQWRRLESGADADASDALRSPIGAPAEDVAPQEDATPDATEQPPAESVTETERSWVEVPDSARLEPVRAWLGELPTVHREPVAGDEESGPPLERGVWMRLTARNLKVLATAWERRPLDTVYLGNARVRALLGDADGIRPSVRITSSGVDWFTVSAEWQAEGFALTEADLKKLRTANTRFVKLTSGWVRRDAVQALKGDAQLLADLGIEPGMGDQRITVSQLAQARAESLEALDGFGADERTVEQIERLRELVRNFTGLPQIPVPALLTATLRPYQRDGLDFLVYVTKLGLGAILADDMGLGKTVQALAWIEWLREQDPDGGPVLVVCPASVLHNWQRESERFTPHLRVLALTSGEERHALRSKLQRHDIVLTNYALLRRDIEHWRPIPLRAAILDEAQNIKNPGAAVSRAVLELNTTRRLALTGTPLENRALDLWSIMRFVNPGYLGPRAPFVARYDRVDAPAHARSLLAARLRPVMVRRLKAQVAPELPDRIEERRESKLTPGQRKLYLAELMRGRETLQQLKASEGGIERHKIEVLAALTRLRQVCCHPALVGGRANLGSGKFDALFEILEPLLAEGHKVLVFSQFVQCLKLLAVEMKDRKIKHHMLTGSTTKREEVVDGFENDPEPCVFLISLKAGGSGLNLTAASYVVLFDPWWNPAVEAQAIDRAHRIGQTRTVIAFRMLAEGTIEEKIWELQQRKAALASEVLGEDGFARTLTRQDLDYLLG